MASKNSPEIQITFNSVESCEMQSGRSGHVIYFNVTNLIPQPTKIFVSPSSYTTKKGEEIDQDVFLNGLGKDGFTLSSGNFKKIGCVYFKESLARFSTGDKLRLTAWIDGGSISHEFLFECTDAASKKFELLSSSLEPRIGGVPEAVSQPTPSKSKKEITKIIERLELLEEKFGMEISALYATSEFPSYIYPTRHYIEINFDVTCLNGNKLGHNICIKAGAYNSSGQLLDSAYTSLNSLKGENFMGFASEEIFLHLDQEPARIRLFPYSS